MFIWKGSGFVVAFLALFGLALTLAVSAALHVQGEAWPLAFGLTTAGLACWPIGRLLSTRAGHVEHSFCSIAVEYWAPILAILGVVLGVGRSLTQLGG